MGRAAERLAQGGEDEQVCRLVVALDVDPIAEEAHPLGDTGACGHLFVLADVPVAEDPQAQLATPEPCGHGEPVDRKLEAFELRVASDEQRDRLVGADFLGAPDLPAGGGVGAEALGVIG